MKHLLLLLSLMCSLCLQAKDGKIKYGKYVIYEGGIEKKQPHGFGTLKVTTITSNMEISGLFNGNKITDAVISNIQSPNIKKKTNTRSKIGNAALMLTGGSKILLRSKLNSINRGEGILINRTTSENGNVITSEYNNPLILCSKIKKLAI